ncbi:MULTISPECIES: aldose epimerase [unclassified Coleofasciculus]|uniref:aldose epimerase family protein n=1 Tax=unclassified Coleofasciculus TaxID=2692782 RepID=UPI00188134E6|nr:MULTISPECIES: aldose epimerase [unclassified Coleofasciculus]MBE9129920.1 aldose epimerase [Coleofasciculus sp. LEGE 07081]MBE9152338.1 aldose epimerase [Coleofasciculus sp. LEGE 07092]
MFAIALKQNQYPTYILTDQEAHSCLEVVPERGGLISHWSLQGQDILYFDADRFKDPNLSVRGGIPILFPICGNLPDNTYTHKGKHYQLKQHGFARDLPWQVTDQITDNQVSLTLVLNSNEQTRQLYPFDFQLTFTYQLKGNTLEIHQRFTNHSTEVMPFSSGFHPYFSTSDKTQLQFQIPASQYQDQITKTVSPFSGSFDSSRDEIDVAFSEISGNSASVNDTGRSLKLDLTYSDLYSTLVFWTVQGKDYYCLEPWSAPRNALNTGENLTHLSPGESFEAWIKLAVTFL